MKEIPSSKLLPGVADMMANQGFYLCYVESRPDEIVPIFSTKGRIYSMFIDAELDPRRFMEGAKFVGPFDSPAHARPETQSSNERDPGTPEKA